MGLQSSLSYQKVWEDIQMFKRSVLFQSMLLAMVLPGVALAEVEVGGYLKNETAGFTKDGQVTGIAENTYDEEGHDKFDLMKFENSARIFLNGDLGEESSWHGDLNLIYDSEAVDGYKGHELYTQNDYLRELYVDTNAFGFDFRLGKQQVVWGTADGIKLLDIINPTDYREMNQNAMEDARIPVWMINAERNIGNNGNFQLIVSQAEENKIAGLNSDGDQGHTYLMKGVDTITGEVNGFLNIIPKLTDVATSFSMGAANSMFGSSDANMDGMPDGLVPFSSMSVDMFSSLHWTMDETGVLSPTTGIPIAQGTTDSVANFINFETMGFEGNGFVLLNAIAQQGLPTLMGAPPAYGNNGETNLMNESGDAWTADPVSLMTTETTVTWDARDPVSAFGYMPNASFATFNNSSGNLWLADMLGTTEGLHGPAQSEYVRDYPDATEPNFGMRYKHSTDMGLNFSVNYFYGYSHNPSVSLSCRDSVTGEALQHELRQPKFWQSTVDGSFVEGVPTDLQTYVPMIPNYGDDYVNVIGNDEVRNFYDGTIGVAYNSAGEYYGAFNPTTGGLLDETHATGGIVMSFVETVNRNNNIGTSFDYALDTGLAPIVLRGEFLYTQDEMQPVVDKRLLGIGYLPEALVSEEHDMFKYVIGVDVNVFTNMMVSGQFIQYRNLDFVDEERTCYTQTGAAFDCSRYTADAAAMSMGNGLQKAEENEEFYSLFFSKPFGDSQEHR
ncbi:MAG: hypothetical protein ABFS39_18850, partial [Pseudomonadota bacterium]